MNSIVMALTLLAAVQAPASQDPGVEVRFHRVYLRNGNFIDGKMVADKPGEVVLQMSSGEMIIRRDQIERVELVKMKSYNEKPVILATPKTPSGTGPTTATPTPVTNTPEQVKRKVDIMIVKLKAAPGGEKEFNAEELKPLGDEGTAYLCSKAPTLELKMLDAIAQAVINLKPGPKTVEVLEGLLGNAVPAVRAMALTALVANGGDDVRLKYIRPQLKDQDPRVKETVLGLLGSVEDETWYEPVIDLCSDPDKEVRSRALRIARSVVAKNNLQDRFLRVLYGNLSNSNDGVRADTVGMISSYNQKESWSHIAPLLGDNESAVRAAAAQGLMSLGVPESGDSIIAAMGREQDKWTRIYLASAAQKLALDKALETLIGWMSDPTEEIRKVSLVAVRAISGVDFGPDPARWQAWLQSRGK